ncbi:MAG: exodeoxyribonuclease VII large subunit [Clostridia bacterium]|nr:exodeoxyribonuclease VII large subunit [Clostridia bacterium]
MNGTLISVSQLNRYVKSVIDGDRNLKSLFVTGEISNFKLNSFSGHIYFTLKDEEAAVKAVMFKTNASRLKFVPSEGMKVICNASVSLYERDGAYQIYVNDIQPDGVGSIAVAFEQLKEKLEKEGLFDKAFKKPIPSFPKKIAVITSETGAAVHDMINVLSRRWPVADIVICPVKVQGEDAPDQMCEAILDVNNYTDCDVIIIGRGGGSREDLWCFNDEKLARVIFVSEIPVISAVGHETDFTICDFVADLRAPTPSAAAELAVPDINEILYYIDTLSHTLKSNIYNFIERLEKHLSDIETNPVFLDRFNFINNYEQLLDSLKSRLDNAAKMQLDIREFNLANTITKLDTLNPAKTLLRGFSIAEKEGKAISSVESLSVGDNIKIKFSDGTVDCLINSVERKL